MPIQFQTVNPEPSSSKSPNQIIQNYFDDPSIDRLKKQAAFSDIKKGAPLSLVEAKIRQIYGDKYNPQEPKLLGRMWDAAKQGWQTAKQNAENIVQEEATGKIGGAEALGRSVLGVANLGLAPAAGAIGEAVSTGVKALGDVTGLSTAPSLNESIDQSLFGQYIAPALRKGIGEKNVQAFQGGVENLFKGSILDSKAREEASKTLMTMWKHLDPVWQHRIQEVTGTAINAATVLPLKDTIFSVLKGGLSLGKEELGAQFKSASETLGNVVEKFRGAPEATPPPPVPPEKPPTFMERGEAMVSKSPEELLKQQGIESTAPYKPLVKKVGTKVKEMYADAKKFYKTASKTFSEANPGVTYDLRSQASGMRNILSGADEAGEGFGLDLKQLTDKEGKLVNKFKVVPKEGVPNRFSGREMSNIQSLFDELTSKEMQKITPEGLQSYGQAIRKYYEALPPGPAGPTPYHALVMKMADEGDNIAQKLMPDSLKLANQKYVDFHKVRKAFGGKVVDAEGNFKTGAEGYFSKLSSGTKGLARENIAEAQKLLGVDVLGESEGISKSLSSAKEQPKIMEDIQKTKGKTRVATEKVQKVAQKEYDGLLKEYEKLSEKYKDDAVKLAAERASWKGRVIKKVGIGAAKMAAVGVGGAVMAKLLHLTSLIPD